MDVAMDTANGLLSPQPHANPEILSPQLSAKRKRDESSIPDEHLSNGNTKLNGIPVSHQGLQDIIADLLEVLQSQDKHAILSRPIETVDDSSEPQAKRQRSESESTLLPSSATICARAASGKYQSLDEVVSDIEVAAGAVSKDLQLPQGSLSKQNLPIPKHEVDLAIEIEYFKKTAGDLVERHKELESLRSKDRTNGILTTDRTLANGNASKPVTQLTAKGDGKVVLTLYGNASTPKQLFSSLQNSVHDTGISHPLREVALPSGITTTHIVPAKPLDPTDEKKRIPTFGELFTPSNSFSLPHPKPSKHATTKSSVVGWYNPSGFENNKPRSSSYFGQPISTGHWLEYNSVSKSPESKSKRRERAPSLSGKPPPPETDAEEDEVKQLETLFRSAYSSFAPTKDETAAVASEGTVNRIWWRHIGERSYERFLRNNEHLDNLVASEIAPKIVEIDENEVNIDEPKDEFDMWVPADAIDPDLQDTPAPKSIHEKETEEVLGEISELLETLNSYQRNRILSPNQFSRSAGGLTPTDPTTLSTPSKPTESEQATYEILKSQLSIMISQLPPYAVAKLNSDQLADLSISTRIPIETEDYKGVMEEDEISARARLASMNVTSAAARATPTAASYNRTPSTSSLYGNQYGSTPRGGGLTGSYYAQSPVRQSAAVVNNLPRASAPQPYTSQTQYAQRQAPATGYRAPATATPTYPHQAPHLSQTYSQSNTPSAYFQQTPQNQRYNQSMGSSAGSGMTTSTPQAIMNGRYQPTTHQNYQQRASVSQNTVNYQYNASNIPRQASPQKPLPTTFNTPQASLSQPQRGFSTPTSTQDPTRGYFQRQMSNGTPSSQSYPSRSHQAPTTNNNGVPNYVSAAGYATVMTDAEQSSILERNRRHLAQQQGTSQYAARSAAQPSLLGGVSNSNAGSGGNGQVDSSAGLSAMIDFNKSTS